MIGKCSDELGFLSQGPGSGIKFNLYVGNHCKNAEDFRSLYMLSDMVEFFRSSLRELGHQVLLDRAELLIAPHVVNLLIEYFTPEMTAEIKEIKRKHGADFRFGIVFTEDPRDETIINGALKAQRLDPFLELAEIADFIWPILPVAEELVELGVARKKIAYFGVGVSPLRAKANPLPEPDIDILFMGQVNPYRNSVLRLLRKMGLVVEITGGFLPDYLRLSLLERSKAALDMGRGWGVRFVSPIRLSYILDNGIAGIGEKIPQPQPLARWYDYIMSANYADLAEACAQFIQNNLWREAGDIARSRALESFAQKDFTLAASRLPVFQEIRNAPIKAEERKLWVPFLK